MRNQGYQKLFLKKKKTAWEYLCTIYSQTTGIEVNTSQMTKMLQNMKTKIKNKTDVKATGNKKIKLKDWEKNLLSILGEVENPVFTKVPGSCTVGVSQSTFSELTEKKSNNNNCSMSPTPTSSSGYTSSQAVQQANTPSANAYVRPSVNKLLSYESDETKDLTTPQLQRLVLLQQFELQKIKIEKVKIELKKLNKNCAEKGTQTDVTSDYCTFINL